MSDWEKQLLEEIQDIKELDEEALVYITGFVAGVKAEKSREE